MQKLKDVCMATKGIEDVFQIAIPDLGENIKSIPRVEEILSWKEYEDRRLVINETVTDEFMFYSQLIIQWNKEDNENNIPVENRKPIRILL